MKNFLNLLFKGAWVGGTLTVPGVSGGSMAMILGVYDRLLTSVNAFVKKKGDKKNAFFRFKRALEKPILNYYFKKHAK